MAKIAFLGLGAMGRRMALNLIHAGHELTVWNRTAAACDELAAAGAKAAATPREAVRGAEFVMSMVRDDEASRQVWLDEKSGAISAVSEHAVVVESSTLTPDWIKTLGAEMQSRHIAFLEAPVSGSRPLLDVMGKTAATVIGPLGSAALTKLCTNTLMGVQVAVIAELIATLQRNNADVANTLQALASTPAWSVILQRAGESIMNQQFAPQFPIGLLEKDFGYMLQSVGDTAKAPVANAAREAFKSAIAEGLGNEQMTAIYKRY